MARVVLHIGTHKTATTTIQDSFAHNSRLLARNGVVYPTIGRATGHHGLAMDWIASLPPVYALPGGSIATLGHVAERHAAGRRTVFLSSEEFSRAGPAGRVDFAAIRAALGRFERVEVLCVLREQWQYVQSIYLEQSKRRQPQPLPKMVARVLDDDRVGGMWTDYNRLYDLLLQDFAPDEITFLDFDRCRRGQGGVLGAVLRHLGAPLGAGALVPVNQGRSNASPGALPGWAANVIAHPAPAPDWMVAAVTEAFDATFRPGATSVLWTRDEFRRMRDYAVGRNARLAQRVAPQQPGFAITHTQMAGDTVFRDDLPTEFWARAKRHVLARPERN